MNLNELKQIIKVFFLQASQSAERIELKEVPKDMEYIDIQTKKVTMEGKQVYFVNLLIMTEDKEERDKLAESFNKTFFTQDGGFIEIGGNTNVYKMEEK